MPTARLSLLALDRPDLHTLAALHRAVPGRARAADVGPARGEWRTTIGPDGGTVCRFLVGG